ncbi:MAG TPA: hypothetical protein VK872_12155, partial [Draconibacterium sp.]|nr:hypothetical protein [Draconibacterium sp.]
MFSELNIEQLKKHINHHIKNLDVFRVVLSRKADWHLNSEPSFWIVFYLPFDQGISDEHIESFPEEISKNLFVEKFFQEIYRDIPGEKNDWMVFVNRIDKENENSLLLYYKNNDFSLPEHQNDPDNFPELRIKQFERYVSGWFQKTEYEGFLRRITLRRSSSEYQKFFKSMISTKYEVILEMANDVPPEIVSEILGDIEYLTTGPIERYLALFDSSFVDTVYYQKPTNDYINDWKFSPRFLIFDTQINQINNGGWIFITVNSKITEKPVVTNEKDGNKRYSFKQNGKAWTLVFDWKKTDGLLGIGFVYIDYLLKNAGKVFSPNELYGLRGINASQSSMTKDEMKAEKLFIDENIPDPIYDEKAKNEIKKKLYQLKNEIEEAVGYGYLEEAEKLRKEFYRLTDHALIASVKSRNRLNKGQSNDERTINRVGKSIGRALKQIEKYDRIAFEHIKKGI